ncbi:MAG: uroporphyrinogen-III synthase [Myxococcota bacterium]|nr:uroporphyrinogen-III synthase [Myxococcota bacterium]
MSLVGRKVLVTRQREQSIAVTRLLEAHGAEVEVIPYIQTRRISVTWPSWEDFDYLVLTSANTVRYMKTEHVVPPQHVKILAVGGRTAAAARQWLQERDIFVPDRFDGEGILDWFSRAEADMKELRVFCPQAKQAKASFVSPLIEQGVTVSTLAIYSIEMCRHDALPDPAITDVLFFSGRTLDSFFRSHDTALGYLSYRTVGVIGQNTREHAEKLGLNSLVCPANPELELLIEALLDKVGGSCDND